MTKAKPPGQTRARTKIRPEQKEGEKDKLDRHWRGLFLDTLADTSNVSEAARAAGVNPARAYKTRRLEPEFARLWYAALLEGYDHLEMETLHRLRMGTGKDDAKFDIANALRLLIAHRDSVARERARRDHEDEQSVLASLNAKLETMRQRQQAANAMLAEDADDAS